MACREWVICTAMRNLGCWLSRRVLAGRCAGQLPDGIGGVRVVLHARPGLFCPFAGRSANDRMHLSMQDRVRDAVSPQRLPPVTFRPARRTSRTGCSRRLSRSDPVTLASWTSRPGDGTVPAVHVDDGQSWPRSRLSFFADRPSGNPRKGSRWNCSGSRAISPRARLSHSAPAQPIPSAGFTRPTRSLT